MKSSWCECVSELRMKILFIFIFRLMSVGDGASREVMGYSEGGILFKSKYRKESEPNSQYFCRSSGSDCDELMKTEAKDKWRNRGRFPLFDNSTAAVFRVLVTELTVEDAGRNQCGADKDPKTPATLSSATDACRLHPVQLVSFLVELVTRDWDAPVVN
ncbi:hypothetical protein AOLI_G00308440 [Acnodon oligacanthus]